MRHAHTLSFSKTKSTNSYRLLSNSSDAISQDSAYDSNPGLHFWKVSPDTSKNSNDGLLAGTIELKEAKKTADEFNKEKVTEFLNTIIIE